MKTLRQQLLLGLVLLALLFGAALWSVTQASDASARADLAGKAHVRHAQTVARVKTERPNASGTIKEFGPAIEQAMREADIPLSKNQLTSPLPERQAQGVMREETEIVIVEVSLRQSLRFMQSMDKHIPGLSWSAFQLSAAKSGADVWTLRVTASRAK